MSTRLANPFTDHPATVGETYFEHFRNAATFGVRMLFAGIACLVHAVLPFLFVNTGSECISRLHSSLSARRRQGQTPGAR